ncbi:MAG: protein translocase SEC61 complex subunit gamma [Candidatus Lokiarchaeota archaeon]|nr:protein translocase SEC61 complex subunit gamma [Candidatus Lokiarchaeota archaeon]
MSNYPKYDKYDKYKQKKKLSRSERIRAFIQNTKRVLKVATKPSRKEFMTVLKICMIGIVLLGAVSYVLQLIFSQVIGEGIFGW